MNLPFFQPCNYPGCSPLRLPPGVGYPGKAVPGCPVGSLLLEPPAEMETERQKCLLCPQKVPTVPFFPPARPWLMEAYQWDILCPAAPVPLPLNGTPVIRETRSHPAPATMQQQTVFLTLGIYFWALKVKHPPVSCRSLEWCLSEELGLDPGVE